MTDEFEVPCRAPTFEIADGGANRHFWPGKI